MRLDNVINNYEMRRNQGAYVAIIEEDGTVNISHAYREDIQLESEQKLQEWIKANNLNKGDYIKVIVVNSNNIEGEKPKEL